MKIINLFGGPGTGKSTTAAGLFHLMKVAGMQVELVTEYAKDMTWEQRHNILTDQLYMFAKQHRRIARLKDMMDFVVTDSPLMLSLVYTGEEYPPSFTQLVLDYWRSYENRNFFLVRTKPYVPVGRTQSAEEAKRIDNRVRACLDVHEVPYVTVEATEEAPGKILKELRAEGSGHVPEQ